MDPTRTEGGRSWIVSRRFDLAFFHGSALAVVLVWAMSRAWHWPAFWIMAFVGVASNGPHLASTWTRVYLDRREFVQRPISFVGVPLAIMASILAMLIWGRQLVPVLPAGNLASDLAPIAGDPGRLFNSIVLYWATWHFAAQCYGLLRLYQRRSGEAERTGHKAEASFIFLVALAGLVWRLHFGPRDLFGREAMAPPIPRALVWAAMAGVVVSSAWVVSDHVRLRAGGVAWSRLGFLAAVLVGFWVPFLAIPSGTDAFFAAACWHGFQYLGIVYFYNKNKHAKGTPDGARLIHWVSQPGRGWAYAALLLAMAGGALGLVRGLSVALGRSEFEVGLVIWTGLTLSHYWIDGLIWKVRRAEVRLNLEPVPG